MTEETPMQPGSVPITELEELVNGWWDDAQYAIENGHIDEYETIDSKADELEELIREHKHD